MRYVSTRAEAPELGFEDVLLTGLARDGGLYVPATWPQLSLEQWRGLRGKSYQDIAFAVMKPFVAGAIDDEQFRAMIDATYSGFDHAAVAPLKQLDHQHWLLELFHGPTLAFKDVAMQLIARLMDWALEKRGETATIIGATSGDTGGAAIEAFKARQRANIFILHPHGLVSPVQRHQMTTVDAANVHNIALEGNFDDCQAVVKALFNDGVFRDRVQLAGVNSINWARIMAQVVYYATSALALGAPDRKVSFTVPTGNFGDVFAGYVAQQMGLPIEKLVIATNANDILDRTLKTGRYEMLGVTATTSPSMDIQVSSNFERLLFELYQHDGNAVRKLMSGLSQSGAFTLDAPQLEKLRSDFASGSADSDETDMVIKQTLKNSGELLDPHSATGYAVARKLAHSDTPMITLATAHPAKFPDAVLAASGIHPQLPSQLSDLLQRKERYSVLGNDPEIIKNYIETHKFV